MKLCLNFFRWIGTFGRSSVVITTFGWNFVTVEMFPACFGHSFFTLSRTDLLFLPFHFTNRKFYNNFQVLDPVLIVVTLSSLCRPFVALSLPSELLGCGHFCHVPLATLRRFGFQTDLWSPPQPPAPLHPTGGSHLMFVLVWNFVVTVATLWSPSELLGCDQIFSFWVCDNMEWGWLCHGKV
jgi:hypothetical protein